MFRLRKATAILCTAAVPRAVSSVARHLVYRLPPFVSDTVRNKTTGNEHHALVQCHEGLQECAYLVCLCVYQSTKLLTTRHEKSEVTQYGAVVRQLLWKSAKSMTYY